VGLPKSLRATVDAAGTSDYALDALVSKLDDVAKGLAHKVESRLDNEIDVFQHVVNKKDYKFCSNLSVPGQCGRCARNNARSNCPTFCAKCDEHSSPAQTDAPECAVIPHAQCWKCQHQAVVLEACPIFCSTTCSAARAGDLVYAGDLV